MIVSRKLKSYFHTHSIEVLTNYPLCQVLQKPEASGRLLKWAIELGQFDVNYQPRTAIKGHALVDFITEFTYFDTIEVASTIGNAEEAKEVETEKDKMFAIESKDNDDDSKQWTLYVDGASNEKGLGAGMMLKSPEGHKIHYALCFGFQALNNEAEYEALITVTPSW